MIRNTFNCFWRLVSRACPYGALHCLSHQLDVLYTSWICQFMGHFGENSIIERPCRLSGGGRRFIYIGNDVHIQSHCILGCWVKYGNQNFSPSITIGNHCDLGEYTHISSCNRITIGNGLLTGRFVYIGDNCHGELCIEDSLIPPGERKLCSKGEVIIGNNVWIGDKATVLSGVHLGDNVIVAANAVVNKSFPSNCLVGGVPAKILKQL